jgi:multidrug resistance protein MdtO
MPAFPQSAEKAQPPLPWFWEFLKQELSPYPGRTAIVARMVIAATLVMIIGMTYRLSFTFQGALFTLLISRETTRSTLESARTMVLTTGLGALCLIITAWFVISVPLLHFLSNIALFLVAFFALRTFVNYTAATLFAVVVAVAVPLWDRHVPAETNVEDTLRLTLMALIAVVITAAVELLFTHRKREDPILQLIGERLDAVRSLLVSYAEGGYADPAAGKRIARLALLGTSLVRRFLSRSDHSPRYRTEMDTVASLVRRLVDIAAELVHLGFEPSDAERRELRSLATIIGAIRNDLMRRRCPAPVPIADEVSPGSPLLQEMQNVLALISRACTGTQPMDEYLPRPEAAPRLHLLVPDAFVNPVHFQFAVRGCIAASACFIIYNALAYPGISTSVTTCLLTALSTIGASRQKQILRLAGFLLGGLVLGMGSQIFILPHLSSIGGFTLLFIPVTAIASWIMTSGPRLSYLGLQAALAFYLINLSDFAIQTSLYPARDRMIGILLGLVAMWLAFDQLWGVRAGAGMRATFISALRLLAQLTREPVSEDLRAAVVRNHALGGTINARFDQVMSHADGVLFEFGPSRRRDLRIRDYIRRWQPQLRSLFLMRIASFKYRLRLPGFELPENARAAQQAYDERSAAVLEELADWLEGKSPPGRETPATGIEAVEEARESSRAEGEEQERLDAFINLYRHIDEVITSLADQITTVDVSGMEVG